MTATDDELMARVRQRNAAAFAELVDRHLTSVHRYLTRLLGSPADADDMAQETFLRLWQRADRYAPGKVQLTTWLHRVAHNLAVDELRRRPPPGEESSEATAAPGSHDRSDPEARAMAAETERRLAAALRQLPAGQRAALLLCQVQGFSNRDAATIMDVSVRALESLLSRARQALRLALADILVPADVTSEGNQHDISRIRARSGPLGR